MGSGGSGRCLLKEATEAPSGPPTYAQLQEQLEADFARPGPTGLHPQQDELMTDEDISGAAENAAWEEQLERFQLVQASAAGPAASRQLIDGPSGSIIMEPDPPPGPPEVPEPSAAEVHHELHEVMEEAAAAVVRRVTFLAACCGRSSAPRPN